MDQFLAEFGLNQNDLFNIVAITIALFILLGILRAVFRLTRTIMRMGCAIIILIVGIFILLQFIGF